MKIEMQNKTEDEILNSWTEKEVKVSVVCITYNHERYISEAIDSFLSQKTTFAFEIIIGEDCSTDSTLEIIKKYKKIIRK